MKNLETAAFLFFCENRFIDGENVIVNNISAPVPIKPEWHSYRDEILASDGMYTARLSGCRHGHVGFVYKKSKVCVLCYRMTAEDRRKEAEKRREIARIKREEELERRKAERTLKAEKRQEIAAAKRDEEQKLRAAKREEEHKRLQAAREASAAKRREARVTALFDKAAKLRDESDRVYIEAMELAATPPGEDLEGLSPRQTAIAKGERWYMPDTPCPKCGQIAERYVATGACRGCK